jgi:hypothetical protein
MGGLSPYRIPLLYSSCVTSFLFYHVTSSFPQSHGLELPLTTSKGQCRWESFEGRQQAEVNMIVEFLPREREKEKEKERYRYTHTHRDRDRERERERRDRKERRSMCGTAASVKAWNGLLAITTVWNSSEMLAFIRGNSSAYITNCCDVCRSPLSLTRSWLL